MTSHHESIAFLNHAHMAEIILYIQSNPGCSRTDIYRNVARGDRMSDKIDLLLSNGIVEDSSDSPRISSLGLTDIGIEVASHLRGIMDILGHL